MNDAENHKLPDAVVPVDTTVPVFIGYTMKQGTDDHKLSVQVINGISVIEPVRITSLEDYENIFGKCLPEQISVVVKETHGKQEISTSFAGRQIHTMYYHLQLFYANGGRVCYIASVGDMEHKEVKAEELTAGLEAARRIDEIMLYVFPQLEFLDAAGAAIVYQATLKQAYEQNRFAIFDCFDNENPLSVREALGTQYLEFGAVYHPYLKTTLPVQYEPDSLKIDLTRDGAMTKDSISFEELPEGLQKKIKKKSGSLSPTLPPAAAVAAAYGGVDRARGAWNAPADVILESIYRPTKDIDEKEQMKFIMDSLTGKSLNIIRWVEKKQSSVVVGARTLAGNHKYWKYVSMRRLFMMVENSIRSSVKQFSREANNVNTWVTVQSIIESYLMTLWYPRVILGAEPEKAFYVQVGLNETMTQQDIDEGRMIVEVGLAAIMPSDFIPIQIVQTMEEVR